LNAAPRPVLHVVAGILRRGDQIVIVRQAAPGEESSWSLPGGALEDGELLNEGLQREVFEETGLRVSGLGRLAFVLQFDNRLPEHLHRSRGPGRGYHVTVWTFEADAWDGELESDDPDGLVSEACFVPVGDAIGYLEAVPWHLLTVEYLRGEVEAGSLHLQRWHDDGRIEVVAPAGG